MFQNAKTILFPLPTYGFDPTESAVPWEALTAAGCHVVFATPKGNTPGTDTRMLTGEGLPVLFKKSLMAQPSAVEAYRKMEKSQQFLNPLSYEQIRASDYSALYLTGGHDKGMREYLESEVLQSAVAYFFDHRLPVAAICHGTLLAARSKSQVVGEQKGKSVLWGRKTTGLTKGQEQFAYWLTAWKLGDYYRTYPIYMMDELISFLKAPSDYDAGPGFPIPLIRDSKQNLKPGFTCRDDHYLSARWPGDVHRLAQEFLNLLKE